MSVSSERCIPPIVCTFLYLPYGLTVGFTVVTLAYLLSRQGVDSVAIAGLIGLSFMPNTWSLLWSPLVDTISTNKVWYAISTLLMGLGMIVASLLPATTAGIPLLSGVVFVYALAATFSSAAACSLIAHHSSPDQKGRAAGWTAAGNVGGAGFGGGAALWISTHTGMSWLGAAVLAAICAASLLLLLLLPPSHRGVPGDSVGQIARNLARDTVSLGRSRRGLLALLAIVSPAAVSGVSNLWAAVAQDWNASADTVALATGAVAGLIGMPAAVIAGYVADRMDRMTAYMACGVAVFLCDVAMIEAPRTADMFLLFVCLNSFLGGAITGTFSAVAFEAVGRGAAATKIGIFVALNTASISLMTVLEGYVHASHGAGAMLATEAGSGLAAIAALAFLRTVWRDRNAAV